MDIVVTVAVLAPIVALFVLATAVTVHFFWLSHAGRWPPDLASPAPKERDRHGPAPARRRRAAQP